MPRQKRIVALAVLFFLPFAAFAGKILLPQTHADAPVDAAQKQAAKNTKPAGDGTRQTFARAMSKVKEGMLEKDVLALLGKPDDIKTHNDPGGISTTRTKEIWRYGTNGHLTFPTLGCVYIDNDGKAQYIYGGHGEPPDAKMFSEAELRSLLRLIDKAPPYYAAYQYDPLAVIQIVNALQPLGKDKALAAIDEYLRVASSFHGSGREGVFLVLRVLFDVPDDPGHMPVMYVGLLAPEAPENAKMPRWPILLQDDVPLLVVSSYFLGGQAEPPESHVKYFRAKGRLREKPLAPGNAPLGLLNSWAKEFGKLYDEHSGAELKLVIANQLLNLVDSVYRQEPDIHGFKFWPDDNVDGHWKSIEAEVAKLDIRWNKEKNRYTYKDGTHLPDRVEKLYRRHIWNLEGLNGEAKLIVERTDTKHVWVSLEWSGKAAQKMPAFVLNVFAANDKANALAQMRPTSIGAVAGDEAHSSQSFSVELAEGEDLQARLSIGKAVQLSPVYRP